MNKDMIDPNENNPAYEIAQESKGYEREGHEYWCINDMIHHGKKCQCGVDYYDPDDDWEYHYKKDKEAEDKDTLMEEP